MASTLDRTLRHTYHGNFRTARYSTTRNIHIFPYNAYMEIPLEREEPVFEMPVMALPSFRDVVVDNIDENADMLVKYVNFSNDPTSLATVDAAVRNLLDSQNAEGFIPFCAKNEPSSNKFYIGQGTIFNRSFRPILMTSWKILRMNEVPEMQYKFLQPILRIDPYCWQGNSSVERYITNKLLKTAMFTILWGSVTGIQPCADQPPIIIIGSIPFEVQKVQTPSIHTTTEGLKKIIADNMEEFTL